MHKSEDKMASKLSSYGQENAMLFAKLAELNARVSQLHADQKIAIQKQEGLNFEIKKLHSENQLLSKELIAVKKENQRLNSSIKNIDALEKQNFTIRNKIAKIAVDINGQEVGDENWQDLIETLIAEIDLCIEQLQS